MVRPSDESIELASTEVGMLKKWRLCGSAGSRNRPILAAFQAQLRPINYRWSLSREYFLRTPAIQLVLLEGVLIPGF